MSRPKAHPLPLLQPIVEQAVYSVLLLLSAAHGKMTSPVFIFVRLGYFGAAIQLLQVSHCFLFFDGVWELRGGVDIPKPTSTPAKSSSPLKRKSKIRNRVLNPTKIQFTLPTSCTLKSQLLTIYLISTVVAS